MMGLRSLGSGRLARKAFAGLFLFMPLVAHFASHGVITLLLAATALAALDPQARKSVAKGGFRWLAATFLPLLLFALATSPLAVDPGHSAILTLRLFAILASIAFLWKALADMSGDDVQFLRRVIAVGGLVFLLIVGADMLTNVGLSALVKGLRRDAGKNDYLTYMNIGIAVLTYLGPIYLLAVSRWLGVAVGAAYLILALMIAFFGNASTPMLGAGLAALAAALVFLLGRRALGLMAVCFVAGILAAPTLVSDYFERRGGLAGLEQDVRWSGLHRLYVWNFAAERISEKPVLGWGLDASRDIPGGHENIPGYSGVEYMPLHPHNGALQIRMELGLPGALLLSLVFWRMFSASSRYRDDKPTMAAGAALLASYAGPGILSFGLWQNWWLATLGVSALALSCLFRPKRRDKALPEGEIIDHGDHRTLKVGGAQHRTEYSKRIVEEIVARKGWDRAVSYLSHRHTRAAYVKPLTTWLNQSGRRGLRVLEVGCEAGHVTEYLNEQDFVGSITAFEVDASFAKIAELKWRELNLSKVESIDHLTSSQTRNLPYADKSFDLILVLAVVEHLPFEDRHCHVDEMWRKLKPGGIIAFLDTPNRYYPLESHSVGLAFIARLDPQLAFLYARLFGKLEGVPFAEFMRPGTGWRNASYHECLPRGSMVLARDISREAGYGFPFFVRFARGRLQMAIRLLAWGPLAWLCERLGVPFEFFVPNLQLVFVKERDFEQPAGDATRPTA